jgi:hypothetical protein
VREGTASGAPPAPALLAALEGLSVALAWARESLERELAAIGPRRRAMHRFAVLQGRPGRRLSARA